MCCDVAKSKNNSPNTPIKGLYFVCVCSRLCTSRRMKICHSDVHDWDTQCMAKFSVFLLCIFHSPLSSPLMSFYVMHILSTSTFLVLLYILPSRLHYGLTAHSPSYSWKLKWQIYMFPLLIFNINLTDYYHRCITVMYVPPGLFHTDFEFIIFDLVLHILCRSIVKWV